MGETLANDPCLKCQTPLAKSDDFATMGLHAACFAEWFKLKTPEPFSGFRRRQADSQDLLLNGPDTASWNTSFFHGRFKKYSATLAGESYIFKVKEDMAPELPDNEYLCNQIAHNVGLPVPDFYLVKFGGERAFVTKNFVRRIGGAANLVHLCHHRPVTAPYDCETLLGIILKETGRHADAEIFVKTCLFDALVGNHDRHGRNLGLLVTSKGTSLAPIYDNTSALGLEHGEFLKADWNPSGKIATKATMEPTGKDYVLEFIRLGYRDQVAAFVRHLHLAKLLAIVDRSFCSDFMKDAMKSLITKRAKEIIDGFKA